MYIPPNLLKCILLMNIYSPGTTYNHMCREVSSDGLQELFLIISYIISYYSTWVVYSRNLLMLTLIEMMRMMKETARQE
jgi:hypothetical protein